MTQVCALKIQLLHDLQAKGKTESFVFLVLEVQEGALC